MLLELYLIIFPNQEFFLMQSYFDDSMLQNSL